MRVVCVSQVSFPHQKATEMEGQAPHLIEDERTLLLGHLAVQRKEFEIFGNGLRLLQDRQRLQVTILCV
jgi:hypothetical protein